jgi:hypothetical protein
MQSMSRPAGQPDHGGGVAAAGVQAVGFDDRDYAGLLDAMLARAPGGRRRRRPSHLLSGAVDAQAQRRVGGFTSCCSLQRGAGRGCHAAVLDERLTPRSTTCLRLSSACADDNLETAPRQAGEGLGCVADGRVSHVGAWSDHHHNAGGRVSAAGGGLSGLKRERRICNMATGAARARSRCKSAASAGWSSARSSVKRPRRASTRSCAATWKS